MRQFTKEEQEAIDRIKSLPWAPRFHRTIDNPSAPGGKIDMYLLVDEETGEGIVSLGVPHGHGYIADWIAGCCADPWFVKQPEFAAGTEMAIALNNALKPWVDEDGSIDGYSVSMAALVTFEAYMTALPKHARNELANRLLAMVNHMRTK